MKYQNKKNGKVAVEAEFNERFKTYTLVFEDGSSTAVTTSTFKRWYKKLEDEVQEPINERAQYVAEIMEQKKELGIECPPINEVEIVDEAKIKAAKAAVEKMPAKKVAKVVDKVIKREKKEKVVKEKKVKETFETRFTQLTSYLKDCGYTFKPSGPKCLDARMEGKKTLFFYIGRDKAVLLLTAKHAPEDIKPDRIANCPLSHRYDIHYDNLEALKDFMR